MSTTELILQTTELTQSVVSMSLTTTTSYLQTAANKTGLASNMVSIASMLVSFPTLVGALNPTAQFYNLQVQAAAFGANIGEGNYQDAAGNLISFSASLATIMFPQARALSIALSIASLAVNQQVFGNGDGNWFDGLGDWNFMSEAVASDFNAAQSWVQRRDPLIFDLDGDGLETVALSSTNPILFDHDGDGLKNGTGWVSPDDGFLVLDRNGNGAIDSGRELFGDSTPLASGANAVDGFAALAQEDTNGDGKVNASPRRAQ